MTQLADQPMTMTPIPADPPPGPYQAEFARFERDGGAGAPPWLAELRRSGADAFARAGFPTRKLEEWRFTDVSAIAAAPFALAAPSDDPAAAERARSYAFGADALAELVFVNGHYRPQLSRLGTLPAGVRVMSLREAVQANEPGVRANLGRQADLATDPFAALNTAFLRDGAYVFLPRNTTLDGPVHLLFVTAAGGRAATHPRVLIVAEENAEAQVVETYAGSGSGAYLTNAVTEFVVAAHARVDHCKVQEESPVAFHLATTRVHLAGQARFVSHSATLGGLLTRNDVACTLAGEYADATLNGLVLLDGVRHCDNHTLLDHAAANCPSHELYKHVLSGRSTGVFKGKILVRKDSQKTDSKQSTKTLLLSDDAQMNSMPALEIYADDVKCTHGSTVGPIDEEQVFYLRSRGLAHEAAKHLMTYAFAADITRRIRVAPARARIENYMAAQHGLPLDLRINDLASHDLAVTNI
jgi:Fe-S cluster assembly protein SufD